MSDVTQKKDIWDRFTALASILVPAAIALAGHFIAQGLKQAELEKEEQRAQQSQIVAESNTKIAQANLINTMMKSLTSANPQERKLAVQAVLLALPEQGPVLARTIAQTDEDLSVQAAAQTSLDQRARALIRDLFADDAGLRISAAKDLVQGWRNDSGVVQELVDFTKENADNANGIYNAVVVLSEFSPVALAAREQHVHELIELAKRNGQKTELRAAALARRLAQPDGVSK